MTDEQCTALTRVIRNGFPLDRGDLPEGIRTFWPMREALYEISGVPFRDHRMLIPSQLRAEVLEGLHGAHQGINEMLNNARQRLFWPGLDS